MDTKPGIIIQARMRSTRLPGKVIADVEGVPLLARLIRRMRLAKSAHRVVTATGPAEFNAEIVELAAQEDCPCWLGSESDTLDRIITAAREFRIDPIIRVTADNPLIDPTSIDLALAEACGAGTDYYDNLNHLGLPHGFGCEIVTLRALEFSRAEWQVAENLEHVTWGIRRHLALFNVGLFIAPASLHRPGYRLSVDHAEDLEVVRHVYRAFGGRDDAGCDEIIPFLDDHPEIRAIQGREVEQLMTSETLARWQLPVDDALRTRWAQYRAAERNLS